MMWQSESKRKLGWVRVVFWSVLLAVADENSVIAGTADWLKLPDTGQSKCYNYSTEIPCPEPGGDFYGQDANYQRVARSYQVNGDGTVTDLNTKLVWQRDDDGVIRTWADAIAYCEGLTLGGASDWRLPAILELTTLADYGRENPAIDTTAFPNSQSPFFCWSSTSSADNTSYAWRVDFNDGRGRNYYKLNSYYARCVRGGL